MSWLEIVTNLIVIVPSIRVIEAPQSQVLAAILTSHVIIGAVRAAEKDIYDSRSILDLLFDPAAW